MKAKDLKNVPKGATQDFIEIEEVFDDIVMFKDYSCVNIIEVGAINYWFLSQEEQESVIYSYAEFLNSLSFPIQILILAKKMDITSYLDYLDAKIQEQKDAKFKQILKSYKEFIKNIVTQHTVLERRYFIVIPFSPLELGISGATKTKLNKQYVLNRAKTSLYPKRDHVLRLLAKMGLKGEVLNKQKIVELFHNLYNPTATGVKLAPIESYTDIVQTS